MAKAEEFIVLELIDKGSCTEAHPTPLLFIHGGWHAAWCWDDHFLNYFATKGYRALAVNLRGHGASDSSKPLRRCSIGDYVDDVRSIVDGLPNHPVLIGHSMGGYVTQKYLETYSAPAAVLLGSLPPRGCAGLLKRYLTRHPWRLLRSVVTGRTMSLFETAGLVRENFFSTTTPESTILHCLSRLQEESRRIQLDGLFLNLPRPDLVDTAMLVMGGEHDRCFPAEDVRATALAYGTSAEIIPAMGHDMMLEPGWQLVADRIDEWLDEMNLVSNDEDSST